MKNATAFAAGAVLGMLVVVVSTISLGLGERVAHYYLGGTTQVEQTASQPAPKPQPRAQSAQVWVHPDTVILWRELPFAAPEQEAAPEPGLMERAMDMVPDIEMPSFRSWFGNEEPETGVITL